MRKRQSQSSKFQRNPNLQPLNRSAPVSAACFWNSELGAALGFGYWSLEFRQAQGGTNRLGHLPF